MNIYPLLKYVGILLLVVVASSCSRDTAHEKTQKCTLETVIIAELSILSEISNQLDSRCNFQHASRLRDGSTYVETMTYSCPAARPEDMIKLKATLAHKIESKWRDRVAVIQGQERSIITIKDVKVDIQEKTVTVTIQCEL